MIQDTNPSPRLDGSGHVTSTGGSRVSVERFRCIPRELRLQRPVQFYMYMSKEITPQFHNFQHIILSGILENRCDKICEK